MSESIMPLMDVLLYGTGAAAFVWLGFSSFVSWREGEPRAAGREARLLVEDLVAVGDVHRVAAVGVGEGDEVVDDGAKVVELQLLGVVDQENSPGRRIDQVRAGDQAEQSLVVVDDVAASG